MNKRYAVFARSVLSFNNPNQSLYGWFDTLDAIAINALQGKLFLSSEISILDTQTQRFINAKDEFVPALYNNGSSNQHVRLILDARAIRHIRELGIANAIELSFPDLLEVVTP